MRAAVERLMGNTSLSTTGTKTGTDDAATNGLVERNLAKNGGGRSRARTCDPGLVRAVLFQLSYPPVP
jgi:hypothetical protein